MRLACSFALSTSLLFPNFADLPQAPQQNKDQQPPPKAEAAPLKQPLAFGLEDGTPIKLRLTRNLSSADATTGDRVDFEVLEDVKVKVWLCPRRATLLRLSGLLERFVKGLEKHLNQNGSSGRYLWLTKS